jgi:hypothetical protein
VPPIDPDLAQVIEGLALATAGHPYGDSGHRRGRSGAVTARSEPRLPASGGGGDCAIQGIETPRAS